ncbi:MAG TPA: hypothetical protein PKW90_24485, partial [Myxococcota bacterium]|nr:hypothetical protein [Myxococcota bacterium]
MYTRTTNAAARQAQDWLVRLCQVDSTSGRETELATVLTTYLREAGADVELLGATDDRPNLIARLEGRDPGPTLCFLAHVDTVLAEPS